MKPIDKTADLLPTLQSFEVFQDIADVPLQWLIDHSEYHLYEVGEELFYPGMPVDYMYILIEGKFAIRIQQGGQIREVGTPGKGTITGILPFSRMKAGTAHGNAIAPMKVLALHKKYFSEMVDVSYELTQALVSVMTSRVREFTHVRTQNEKLMALGKLSAGLAHELNNPAAAMVRSADELYKRIHKTPESFKAVITMRVTAEQTDAVNEILFSKLGQEKKLHLSLLEREERVDDMVDWLEDHDIENGEDIAEVFVDYDFTVEDLDRFKEIVDGKDIAPLFSWIESTLSLERLVEEIQDSADRISTLVKSVKSYSHMDRGSAKDWVDIRDGLHSTAIMLKHKIKTKNIQLQKNFPKELPKVKAAAGELNQVWTNIIANAIDALDPGGTITIDVRPDREFVVTEISDTGHGIPEEIMSRIFEPFFTTKAMGEGTGIGLDVVKRIVDQHNGSIKVESKPGNTKFEVCLPVESK